MPAKSSPTKPPSKSTKKDSKKVARKSAKKTPKKVVKKDTKKVAKKAATKSAKKIGEKAAKKDTKKVAKKAAQRSPTPRSRAVAVPVDSRHRMIEIAAYYRAERRNFQNGDPVADWLSSEKEIDELLNRTADRR